MESLEDYDKNHGIRDFDTRTQGDGTNQEWLDLLPQGSDKKRFQYCINSDGLILHMCVLPKVTLEEPRLILYG